MGSVLLEARPFRPFKSDEEYLIAMKEDLAEWLHTMYPHLGIFVENFMAKLETGVALCEHANNVKSKAAEYVEKKHKKMMTRSVTTSLALAQGLTRISDVKFFSTAKPGTFFARDNVSNFIHWCRQSLEIIECLLFESDDLIMRKNEKHVILCLLEVARRGAKIGMLAPMLVQMERQIDREIAADNKKLNEGNGNNNENQSGLDADDEDDSDLDDEEPMLMYGPQPQIITNDLKSLDEMVRDLVEKCTCPTQFPMIRVSEGKYRIGDTKVLIFVRILRNHVMVRVGGGWDTLSHYLDKHDPCRCRSQHRTTQGARLVNKPGAVDLHGSHVHYDRSANPASALSYGASSGGSLLGPPMNSLNRSRSRSPSHFYHGDVVLRRSLSPNLPRKSLAPPIVNRSRSPTPNYTSTHVTKLSKTSPVHQAKYVNGKNSTQHVTSIQIPVETTNSKILKSEASLQVSDPLTDHSDTTSEMSDEGYRSLGLIQDRNKQRSSLYSQNSVEDVEDNGEHPIDGVDDLNDFGLRKTHFSQIYENAEFKAKPTPPIEIRCESPQKTQKLQTSSRANSSMERNAKYFPPQTPKKNQTKINNTWNGKAKPKRPSITTDTYSPPPPPSPSFSRNSSSRRSVTGAMMVGHHERRSSSVCTSPTKSFKDELLKITHTNNDALIAKQVKELLRKYGNSIEGLEDTDHDGDEDVGKFRRSSERMSLRSPRRDTRPDTHHISRIPAPVLHKA